MIVFILYKIYNLFTPPDMFKIPFQYKYIYNELDKLRRYVS